jgi:preprotein translocase subunit SecF
MRWCSMWCHWLTFLAAVFFLFSRGLHLSVEFTGGTVMEVSYSQAADSIPRCGRGRLGLQRCAGAELWHGSSDVLIRLPVQKGVSLPTK